MTAPSCPACGHADEDHVRESWYDEEAIEGMACERCADKGRRCAWWTWSWAEVIAGTADHEGDDGVTDHLNGPSSEGGGRLR